VFSSILGETLLSLSLMTLYRGDSGQILVPRGISRSKWITSADGPVPVQKFLSRVLARTRASPRVVIFLTHQFKA